MTAAGRMTHSLLETALSAAATPKGEIEGVGLERDLFLRLLLRELAGTLQDVVGLEEASGYISVVGAAMGEYIDGEYRRALAVDRLSREQVSAVLVDLKRRIQGDFFVVEEAEDRIVLGNRACPFGGMVLGRPSLCMMTSNVFGSITAQNLGYAGISLEQTIAEGHPACRVVVRLRPSASAEPGVREYFRRDDAG
jgi:predicted ArsR family transcriptional regulator